MLKFFRLKASCLKAKTVNSIPGRTGNFRGFFYSNFLHIGRYGVSEISGLIISSKDKGGMNILTIQV